MFYPIVEKTDARMKFWRLKSLINNDNSCKGGQKVTDKCTRVWSESTDLSRKMVYKSLNNSNWQKNDKDLNKFFFSWKWLKLFRSTKITPDYTRDNNYKATVIIIMCDIICRIMFIFPEIKLLCYYFILVTARQKRA